MILHIIAKLINFIQHSQKAKIGNQSDDLFIQKRILFHKDIPALATIKALTGERFPELQNIINRFDPIKTESLSEYPKKYELLTKTLIFKLPKQRTRQDIADLLALEFSLWFKHEYLKFKDKEILIDEVYSYKTRSFRSNPFEVKENG
ncbi:MAG TPA: hypothetical protein VGC65_05520 [Bacteroidia bacterium]|jgi:hypothetical protein